MATDIPANVTGPVIYFVLFFFAKSLRITALRETTSVWIINIYASYNKIAELWGLVRWTWGQINLDELWFRIKDSKTKTDPFFRFVFFPSSRTHERYIIRMSFHQDRRKSSFLHKALSIYLSIYLSINLFGGARGAMVIVVGNGHGNTSSNPGRD